MTDATGIAIIFCIGVPIRPFPLAATDRGGSGFVTFGADGTLSYELEKAHAEYGDYEG